MGAICRSGLSGLRFFGVSQRRRTASLSLPLGSLRSVQVEVVRSARRRKTVQLRPTEVGVRISIPATATFEEEQQYVESLLRKYERRERSEQIDLRGRARRLAARHDLRSPHSIEWVDNQTTQWGSCSPIQGTIRISSRIARFPSWVIDAVIVHELVHLSIPSHGPIFWSIADRYPLMERARGFLIAKGMEPGGADDVD